jgi:PqqD family protein of HPr-rel-A system
VPAIRPRIREGLTIVELDGETVVYDEETTELHHLNRTATIVFCLCDGSATMAEMAADLSAVFEVPLHEVEPEVRALIRRFRKVQLLELTGSSYVSDRMEGTPETP